jgi:hypothetical protein
VFKKKANTNKSAGVKNSAPKNIVETKAWQASSKGIGRLFSNYKNVLSTSFKRMSRPDQEALVTRASIIVSMGVTALILALFYPLIPRLIRIPLVPAALVFAWWAGKNFISAVVIGRLEGILNQE